MKKTMISPSKYIQGEDELSNLGALVLEFSDRALLVASNDDQVRVQKQLDKAIKKAKDNLGKPSIIEIKTIIGKGSINEGKNVVHGSALSKEDIEQLKNKLGIRNIPFAISQDATDTFRKMINDRINANYNTWTENYKVYMEQASDIVKKEINDLLNKNYLLDIQSLMWQFDENLKEATRETNGKVLNVIANNLHNFIGGSADLASSTKTYLTEFKDYSKDSYDGKNIWFGVREHAMGAILNGLSLSGFRTFGSTFLSFSDYMKPAIRLAALISSSLAAKLSCVDAATLSTLSDVF
jgi:transketolase